MNIKTSSQCEACKTCNLHTETTNDKFYECFAVKGFWGDVEIGGTSNILKT